MRLRFSFWLILAGLTVLSGRPLQGEVMDAKAFLQKYCISCHGAPGQEVKGEFDLQPMLQAESITPHLGKWMDVMDVVDFREMPPSKPADLPRPSESEYQGMLAWLEHGMQQASGAPKHYTRRLNRAQYNNTMRDLLKVDIDPADAFPQDLGEEGFDTVARVQSISPLLWSQYMDAAGRVVRLAAAQDEAPETFTRRYFPLDRDQSSGKAKVKKSSIDLSPIIADRKKHVTEAGNALFNLDHETGSPNKNRVREGQGGNGYEVVLTHSGDGARRARMKFQNPLNYGRYRLTFRAYAERGHDRDGKELAPYDACVAGIYVNGVLEQEISVPLTDEPQEYTVEFTSDFSRTEVRIAANSQVSRKHLNAVPSLILCDAELEGPLFESWPPASDRAIFGDNPDAAPEAWLEPFISKAFRRPATTGEIERYVDIHQRELEAGATPREAKILAAQAVLVSPSFLYLIEKERPGGQLNDYELASRLSYFLWASMPDETLFDLAASGQLRKPQVFRQQVARMLEDPKAAALTKEFAGQWLALRRIGEIVPDPEIYQDFDDELREAMREEGEAFFQEIVDKNLPVRTFLDADFTFANQRLARHYDLPDVEGAEMRRVSLGADDLRGGVVTQAGILAVHSQQTRTSPVLRGVFVLEKLFNRPPPNPPANVPPLPESEDKEEVTATNLREQMAQHASNPACASCHEKIDPWGLALEEFNGIGAHRTVEAESVTAELFDGAMLTGVRGLKEELVRREADFARGLTEKLLTYGLGRTLDSADRREVDGILTKAARADYGMKALLLCVVESDLFQKR